MRMPDPRERIFYRNSVFSVPACIVVEVIVEIISMGGVIWGLTGVELKNYGNTSSEYDIEKSLLGRSIPGKTRAESGLRISFSKVGV